MRLLLTKVLLLFLISSFGQIVTLDPVFATADDTVTITYDASQGNGALQGLAPPVVYAHTGLITNLSTSASDWKHVQGNWGTADTKVLMTSLGNNLYQIKIHVRSFYGLPQSETALKLAFVFRNANGSIVGRAADGSDIFVDLYDNNFAAGIFEPVSVLQKVSDSVRIEAKASDSAMLYLYVNGTAIDSTFGKSISTIYIPASGGSYKIEFKAVHGPSTITDSYEFFAMADPQILTVPTGLHDGINYTSDTTATLVLYAPQKNFVFVLCDLNDWKPNTEHYMHRTPDGLRWWVEIKGLEPGTYCRFQYWVDGEIKIGDPYSQLVLDPWNDQYIDQNRFPDLPAYPVSGAESLVSLMIPGQSAYDWQVLDFERPDESRLIIYELLVRDFTSGQSFKEVLANLDYLESLGINAIELMPLNEFEGNLSWGYNPSYQSAMDKYYGTMNDLKDLVDACHERGIAVILDVVFNHAFSLSPLCRLYWDQINFKPSLSNPWLNPDAKHPFNVGYDFNHESTATQEWMDQVLLYWIREFKLDGFRFDLSKGFTQRNSGQDVGAWGNYDASRIALLKRMHDVLSAEDDGLYLILEHFANNDEEKELAAYGFMLWGNIVYEYTEAVMGYESNMEWSNYKNRGWNEPKVVQYIESHDEERIVYNAKLYGNTNGSYKVTNEDVTLQRLEAAAVIFFSIPGPKMYWMGTELGYDVSINTNGRTGEKPFKWEYLNEPARRDVKEVFSAMSKLATTEPAFSSSDFTTSLSGDVKRVRLSDGTKHFIALANMAMGDKDVVASFHTTGWWYEFFSGDSMEVTSVNMTVFMGPGEYMLWSNKKYKEFFVSARDLRISILNVYPVPASSELTIELPDRIIETVSLLNMKGEMIYYETVGSTEVKISTREYAPGVYIIVCNTSMGVIRKKIIIQ